MRECLGTAPARAVLAALLLAAVPAAVAAELDVRVKWFASLALLPEEDLERQLRGTPSYTDNLDLRLLVRHDTGRLQWIAHHSTTLVRGAGLDGTNPLGPTLDQSAVSDARRAANLTWELDDGGNHRLVHRFDRLALRYRGDGWGVTLGREAVSWGNGLVFQPLDLFNPFAPTTVDQDYKAGDDLLLVERLFGDGSNLQLLVVARRDEDGELTARAGSAAAKWHRFAGQGEVELVAARHFRDQVYALAWRFPVGGALWRSDLVATRLEAGTWKLSGIVNVDHSLIAAERNLYVFAEYFHSAFGLRRLPDGPAEYPDELVSRLGRGELFNLMRDYLALGARLEWHPLWNQSLTLIANLHDGSSLLQTQLSYEPGDRQRLEVGLVQPLGSAGDEFGGVPVVGEAVTAGGGTRLYARWAFYF